MPRSTKPSRNPPSLARRFAEEFWRHEWPDMSASARSHAAGQVKDALTRAGLALVEVCEAPAGQS